MKNLIYILIALIIGDLTLTRCANPITPTGGPKDTIPPKLIVSQPMTGSINFDDQTITLGFSEYVNADKLKQNLIITPKTDLRFKHIIKRNQLVIKFEEAFDDSTTYSLNFFDGVTDITEKNPVVNLILAFSTGSFIDSMKVSGTVDDLLSKEPSAKFIVGLFPISDSLDFLQNSPTYFTTANDSGEFKLSYVKSGEYRILSFNDENRNLLLDPKEESHGFVSDTLLLYDSIPSIQINSFLQNIKPIQLINNRSIRSYHEIKFSREIYSYTIQPDSIYSSISGTEKDVLRLYNANQFNFGDSISMILSVSDSLSNTVDDTIKIVFNENIGRPTSFEHTISYSEKQLIDNPLYTIKFSKPVITADPSKFVYQTDSTFSFRSDSTALNWNQDQTELKLQTFLDTDSLYAMQAQSIQLDTTLLRNWSLDSIQQLSPSESDSIKKIIAEKTPIEFLIQPGAFISVENDSSTIQKIKHKREHIEAFGTLQFSIVTDKSSFIVQLLNKSGDVAYQKVNDKSPVFNVKPASYTIRVLIDSNADGRWSHGNLMKNMEPEEVYLFPPKIAIRENWIVGEDIQISF